MIKKRLSMYILGVWLVLLPVVVFAQGIIVQTDKTIYKQGEKIKITLKNNSPESIFSIAASSTPVFGINRLEQKDKMGQWKVLPIRCVWPECDIDFDGPGEIKAGQVVNFEWEPRFYSNKEYLVLGKGVYRVFLNWQIRRGNDTTQWDGGEINTEEFTID